MGKQIWGKKWEWEFCDDMGMGGNGNGSDAMGVGGSGNLKTHSRTPLQHRVRWCVTSLQIIQYHRHWYQSKARVRLPISLRSRLTSIISEVEKPFSPLLSTPFSFEALARGSVEPRVCKVVVKNRATRRWKLHDPAISFDSIPACDRQTRTDGHAEFTDCS